MNDSTARIYRTLMEHIKQVFGKWHVSAGNDFNLPEAMGVGHYAGLFGGGVDDYFYNQLPQRSHHNCLNRFSN